MIEETIIVEAPNGLHARPVTELVKIVKSFPGTEVTISTAAKKVKASSMLSILSLGLKKGTEIVIAAEGGDEKSALEVVRDLILSVKD